MRTPFTGGRHAGAALIVGLFFFATPTARAQFIGTFGTPYKPFNGQVTFKACGVTPSLNVNVRPAIDQAWSAARGEIAQAIKDKMGAARKFRGQTAYNINVALASRGELQAMADGPRLAFKYILRGNAITAKITTPTIFGSYADPKFTVIFDVEVIANIGRLPNGKIGVTSVHASVHNSRLQGRNVTGTVGLAIADIVGFAGGPNVRNVAQNAINRQNFSQRLNVAFAPVSFPGEMLSQMSGASVLVRFISPSSRPGPIVR